MLLKCPFCGASIDHDSSTEESPVCPGCNLKLTGGILPTVAPLVSPPATTVNPASSSVNPASPPPPTAFSSAELSRTSPLVSPAEIAAPPIIHPPVAVPVAAQNATASVPHIANPALHVADPVSAESSNHEPKTKSRSGKKLPSETNELSSSKSSASFEPTPVQPAPVVASAAEITPAEHTVLIPSSDGGFVPVDERFTHVEHRGKKIELLNVSHEQRHTSRRIRSSIIFVACLIFLAGFMIWLSKYLQ